jgi:serine/threonine protein kinase
MPPLQLEPVAHALCASEGWQFVAAVGSGAFKETFEILDTRGTRLALKIVRPGGSSARVDREVEAMLQCSHPNIAKLHAVQQGTVAGVTYLYLLEEYLAGGSLTQFILRSGALSAAQTKVLGATLIQAISHMADRALVHRDLKPDNIMLRSGINTPVVVDFGVVRMLAETSLTQSWLHQGPGTPYFAPPEQLRNDKAMINWRADQFSLGVLLSVCAFDIHPYAEVGDHPAQVVARVANRETPKRSFVDAIQAAGLPSLQRMVAPWPVARFRTPAELLAAWESQ